MCKVAERTTRRHNALRDTAKHIVSRPSLCELCRREVTHPLSLHTHLPKQVGIVVASGNNDVYFLVEVETPPQLPNFPPTPSNPPAPNLPPDTRLAPVARPRCYR